MFFTGNVMTSRVNVDAPEYHGSTILAKERPDFVISKDPWFRPVDLQCGSDGALYILDFYNKIIGHYEVDLKHPGRDRHRGRIWKVIHKATPLHKMPDLRTAKNAELIELLGHANFKVRSLAFERIDESYISVFENDDGKLIVSVDTELEVALKETITSSSSPFARSLAFALQHLSKDAFVSASKDGSPEVRTMAMKLISEVMGSPNEGAASLGRDLLSDANSFVRRAAADSLGRLPLSGNTTALLKALAQVPQDDHHLRQVIRIAIRNNLVDANLTGELHKLETDEAASQELLELSLAINTAESASFIMARLQKKEEITTQVLPLVHHVARFSSPRDAKSVISLIRSKLTTDPIQQLALLNTLRVAGEQRGQTVDASLRDWAVELAGKLLDSSRGVSMSWSNEPVPGKPKADNPWELRARVSQDGDKGSLFYDSLVKGEQLTGLYRSEPFELPNGKLSFWCAGHNGMPGTPFNPKNFIRLRDASTHALLREAMPPRNDTAQKIEWDLAEFVVPPLGGSKAEKSQEKAPSKGGTTSGRRGYIELLDADEGSGYAWLAVGRFSIAGLNPSDVPSQQIAAANLIADFKIGDLKSQAIERLVSHDTDARAKEAFARALLALHPDTVLSSLVPLITDVSLPEALREQIAAAVVDRRLSTLARPDAAKTSKDNDDAKNSTGKSARPTSLLVTAVKAIPERLQLRLAETLASDALGANELLKLAQDGHVSPRLLTRPSTKQRLDAIKSDDLHKQVAEVTSGLPNEDEALRKMIDQRRTLFLSAQSNAEVTQRPSLEAGAALFTKHCALCHQVAGKGVLIGPQLDGIGQRGLERVLEDVLDPNRNVDVNFRTTTVVMKDGKIFSGLIRREEGATLVMVDNKGKEFSVTVADIDERVKSNLSLMPANVHEVVNEREFLDLVSFLLSQRQKPEPKSE